MGYRPTPELERLMDQLLGSEKTCFFDAVGEQLPHTIRFNTLRGNPERLAAFLREQGFEFETFPGFSDIYRLLYQPYPIGKSLSHFLGHIYVQDIASMLPPRVLRPLPGERVLDISAAPGSKTTQMAVLMENRGVILANDVVQKRLLALINNLQRLGILNTAVVRAQGESFGNQYFETFDKILLDPACSGLGTLHKSPEVLSWWTPHHVERLAAQQKRLIASAIKALKPGGTMVYSTCTLTPGENEEIIDYALSEFPVELDEVDLPGLKTRPGLTAFEGRSYDPRIKKARRLYPFENLTEGFFIARLRKTAAMAARPPKKPLRELHLNYATSQTSPVKKYLDYLSQHFEIDRSEFTGFRYFLSKSITAVSREIAEFRFRTRPMKSGLTIARPLRQAAKFTTEGVQLFGPAARSNVVELPDLGSLEKFVNRQSLSVPQTLRAQTIVRYRGIDMGYGLSAEGQLKSQFPKAEWPFRLLPEEK